MNQKQEHQLIKQLQLPKSQKRYSYDDNLVGSVMFSIFLMFKVLMECDQILKQPSDTLTHQRKKQTLETKSQFMNKIKHINYSLVVNHEKLQNLLRIIVKLRSEEILEKIKAEEFLWDKKGTDKTKHFFLLKQFYMKIFRIRNFIAYNQRKLFNIISFHESLQGNASTLGFKLLPIQQNQEDIISLETKIQSIKRYIEGKWVREKGNGNRDSLQQLKGLAQLVDRREISNHLLLGIWSGIMVFMLGTIIFLFINYDINFNSEPQFQITFPIWRGMCYFILILWSFSIQSYIFETNGISFRMLTILNNYYIPKYPQLFTCAAFFTTLHMFMFMLYMLALTEFGITFPDNFELHYLPAVSWIVYICFFFIPLPCFHHKKRLYPLFMVVRSLFAPCLGIQVKFHWWTEIWISFRQPFRDVLFTFTYYFIDDTIIYENTIIFETVIGIFIYSLRIIQNIRQMKQNNFIGGMPFFGSIKCTLNIITVTLSYLYRVDELSSTLLIIWIISAVISTSYAYHFDIKFDWNLLQKDEVTGKTQIRKKSVFGTKKTYYTIIFMNLLFRLLWVMNISPDVLRQIPLERYLLILVVSSLEITRRTIWSIFRIENEHIIAEKYYENIGVIKDSHENKKQRKDLLVEMDDLNKTFSLANQKAMKQIYHQFEQEMVEPVKLRQQQIQQQTIETNLSIEEMMKEIIEEIDNRNKKLRLLCEQARAFIEQAEYKDFLNTQTQMMSERETFF